MLIRVTASRNYFSETNCYKLSPYISRGPMSSSLESLWQVIRFFATQCSTA